MNTARGDIRRVEVESWLDIWLDNGPSPPVLLIKRVIKASAYMLAVSGAVEKGGQGGELPPQFF